MNQDYIDSLNMKQLVEAAVAKSGKKMDTKSMQLITLLCEDVMRLGYNGGIRKAQDICKNRCVHDIIPLLEKEKVDRLRDRMTKDEMAQSWGDKKW